MPKTWTDAEDKRLLVAIVQVLANVNVSQTQWNEVVKKMGGDYTASGISQHFNKKLKHLSVDSATPNTPVSSKKAASQPKGSTTKRKRNKKKNNDDDEDDEVDPEIIGHDRKRKSNAASEKSEKSEDDDDACFLLKQEHDDDIKDEKLKL